MWISDKAPHFVTFWEDNVNCPFHVLMQTNFWRYYFYFLLDQAQTHLDHMKVLDELWGKISFKSDNRLRISPLTPIVKIARFRQRYDVAESGHVFTMGVYGEILHLLSNPVEISPQSSSKTLKCSWWVWAWSGRVKIISPKVRLQ